MNVRDVKSESINEQEHAILETCKQHSLSFKKVAEIRFQSTNIFPHMYRVHLSLPEMYRQCCADLNQYNTVCTILIKIDVFDTCGAMICSYHGIAMKFHQM